MTLNQSRLLPLDSIEVEEEQGSIVLTGQLPSFYLKQLAQTIAGSVDGVRRLDNRVEVIRAADAVCLTP